MTNAEMKKMMQVYGDVFYESTCTKLQAEIVRKIMNNKSMNDFEKITMLNQYVGNLSTNDCIVEGVKSYNNR